MLAVILAAAVLAQVVTPPQNVTVRNEITVTAPAPDPALIADASTTSSQAVLNTVIAPAPVAWANDLIGLPDIWRTTPDDLTWNNGAIRSVADLVRNVAAALIALAIMAKGLSIILGREDPSSLGRVLFAALLSFGNLTFWQWGIQLNNALTAAIGSPSLPSLIQPHLVAQIDPLALPGTVIILLVYAIVALLLMFSLLFRLGMIDIMIAAGSLLLLMKATMETEHIASHYTRMSVAVLFSQVLIVLCLRIASVLSSLGSGGVLGTLLSIVVLWLARSAPAAILAGSSSSQRNRWGGIAARLVMRRFSSR